jgi:hypothetical protein
MNLDKRTILEIIFGFCGVVTVGVLFPQVIVGAIAGAIGMWFLKKPINHLFKREEITIDSRPEPEATTYIRALKTRVVRLEAEMRAMHQVVDAKEMKPRKKTVKPATSKDTAKTGL